ncbi:unnamed protein product [Diatraea saccharalis]|uniref:Uncharacterized protein n=1 Tax=Diatraea saccharalis TaxID=40085 RepID=A0A9N9REG9_9NEOP|nr:unnamed protein product [Diatraea saccharalis]
MLLPSRGDSPDTVMHFDSNESTRERKARIEVNLKQIEEAIHMTQPKHNNSNLPIYTVQDNEPEYFDTKLKIDINRLKGTAPKQEVESYNDIFGHIGSDQISSQITNEYDNRAKIEKESLLKANQTTHSENTAVIDMNRNITVFNENFNKVLSTVEVVIMR